MELIPWRPLLGTIPLKKEMDDLIDRFFGDGAFAQPLGENWVPTMDLLENKDEVVVNCEIPGIEPKDTEISFIGDTLSIKGTKKEEKEEKNDTYYRMARRYGNFSRTVRIPTAVHSEKIKAQYKNGVLKITLPKKEEVKPKEIKVEVA